MTNEQLKHVKPVDLVTALRMAFDAGNSYGIASHRDFVQRHEPKGPVCDALVRCVELFKEVDE